MPFGTGVRTGTTVADHSHTAASEVLEGARTFRVALWTPAAFQQAAVDQRTWCPIS
jgi:hypothetical protein